jgi:hypothetical protein
MQQYIFLGNGSSAPGSGRGHHEYLPTLMRQESANGPLRTIIAAAGLAALSNAGNANMFATEAYQLYNEAIRQLRPALSNPEEACLDNSLAAMMLMGTFEVNITILSPRLYILIRHCPGHCIRRRRLDEVLQRPYNGRSTLSRPPRPNTTPRQRASQALSRTAPHHRKNPIHTSRLASLIPHS